jgi:methionyl-tRNA formyltransferase
MKRSSLEPITQTTLDITPVNLDEMNKFMAKQKIKKGLDIVFFGSDEWSIPVLEALEDSFYVRCVVTTIDSPVSKYFKGPILTPQKLDSEFLTNNLSFLSCDLFVVASYGKIIPQSLLDIPKFGALNVHPSLLPKHRGPSPVPETILRGDKITGVTIIRMDAKMDHGPIVATEEIILSEQEIAPQLIIKLFRLGASLIVSIIPDFVSDQIKLKEQNHEKATFSPMLKKESGFFDIKSPPSPEVLDKMIRAYHPWPGVWTNWNGRIVKFLPGDLLQMEGKKPAPKKVFLNNYPDFPL